jgi:hypothetical protein
MVELCTLAKLTALFEDRSIRMAQLATRERSTDNARLEGSQVGLPLVFIGYLARFLGYPMTTVVDLAEYVSVARQPVIVLALFLDGIICPSSQHLPLLRRAITPVVDPLLHVDAQVPRDHESISSTGVQYTLR